MSECFMDDQSKWLAATRNLALRYNNFAICAPHYLLPCKQHRADVEHGDLADALGFVQQIPGSLVFLNLAGSGASRPDHLHFQLIIPDAPFAIQISEREEILKIR